MPVLFKYSLTRPSSAAIFARPDPSRLNFGSQAHSVPLSLICDNIRDPGNLGTMLRCAAAAGCHNVLLTKGMLIFFKLQSHHSDSLHALSFCCS